MALFSHAFIRKRAISLAASTSVAVASHALAQDPARSTMPVLQSRTSTLTVDPSVPTSNRCVSQSDAAIDFVAGMVPCSGDDIRRRHPVTADGGRRTDKPGLDVQSQLK